MFPIRQSATHKVVLGPAVAIADGYTPVTNLDVATADEAEVILHDNATVVDISGYTWAAIATADGYYHLTLQAAISGTVGHMSVVINDDDVCLPLLGNFMVIAASAYDRNVAGTDSPGIKKNTQLAAFMFFLVDSTDDVSGKTGATVAAQRSIDGATFGNCTNTPATEVANGYYKITLSAADLNGDVIALKFTATGANTTAITIVTEV